MYVCRCLPGCPSTDIYEAVWEPAVAPGDLDGDGRAEWSEAVSLIDWLLLGGPEPANASRAGVDGDGSVDLPEVLMTLEASAGREP